MRKRRAHQKTICLVMKRIKIKEQKQMINEIRYIIKKLENPKYKNTNTNQDNHFYIEVVLARNGLTSDFGALGVSLEEEIGFRIKIHKYW